MNPLIVSFLVFGAAFGALTFRHRHLFSEGPSRPAGPEGDGPMARLGWVAVCTMLWPLMSVGGAYGLCMRRRGRRAPAHRR